MFTSNYIKTSAAREFEQSRLQYSRQIFSKKEEDINSLIKENEDAKALGKTRLNKEEAWQGLKWKAETPEKYIPVKESAIITGSRRNTEYGETFIRLTIQPSFATGNLILVKEEIHIYENEKKIIFLGREVNFEEVKKYFQQANENMLLEKPALFNVEHAVKGTEDEPIATWQMVRRSDIDPENNEEAQRIFRIKNLIDNVQGTEIYLQTIKQLSET